MTHDDVSGGGGMDAAEFAKLMGAMPDPPMNPLYQTGGGFMDNPGGFAWVANAESFSAEYKSQINELLDNLYNVADNYKHEPCDCRVGEEMSYADFKIHLDKCHLPYLKNKYHDTIDKIWPILKRQGDIDPEMYEWLSHTLEDDGQDANLSVKGFVEQFPLDFDAESFNAEGESCDACQKDKPIVAHVEFDGPFLSALCKECYAEHLEMGGKAKVLDAESFEGEEFGADECYQCKEIGIVNKDVWPPHSQRPATHPITLVPMSKEYEHHTPRAEKECKSCMIGICSICYDWLDGYCWDCTPKRNTGLPRHPVKWGPRAESFSGVESFGASSVMVCDCTECADGRMYATWVEFVCNNCFHTEGPFNQASQVSYDCSKCDGGTLEATWIEYVCNNCPHTMYGAETFEAPYGGAGAIMDIGKDTPLANFTDEELTKSSAIHGDFDTASIDYSGHQNIEVRAESFEAEVRRVRLWRCEGCQQTYYLKDDAIGCCWDKNADTDAYTYAYTEGHSDSRKKEGFHPSIDKRDSKDFHKILRQKAELEPLTSNIVDVSNRIGETVGRVRVEDDMEDVTVEVETEDGDVIMEGTLDDEWTPDIEDMEYYYAEKEGGNMMPKDEESIYAAENTTSFLTILLGTTATLVGLGLLSKKLTKKAEFHNETDEPTEDPDLIMSPNTGDLSPANYEELVVESTGFAVDIIPMGLDGSFMGSRFNALPTDRFIDYNEPGIGAHTDIALTRNENFREPEQSMVQASETEVKETQAPGQSPYFQMGHEPVDMNYRVLKETTTVSLDPAVRAFIPQSMSGYTGQKYAPPSVYEKMFGLGVSGITPAFISGDTDMGANRFGSRDAQPDRLSNIGGPLSDSVNAGYTDGNTTISLAQWSIENQVQPISDTEAIVIDRSSGARKMIRRV